jgi:hypothetical protein
MNKNDELEFPDPHFGTDKEMLEWCVREGLTPVKDEDGDWDWHAVWEVYQARLDAEEGAS